MVSDSFWSTDGSRAGEVGHQRHGYEAFWVGCLTAFLRKLDTLLASPWTRSRTRDWWTVSAHTDFLRPITITSRKATKVIKIEFNHLTLICDVFFCSSAKQQVCDSVTQFQSILLALMYKWQFEQYDQSFSMSNWRLVTRISFTSLFTVTLGFWKRHLL